MLGLIRQILTAGAMRDGVFESSVAGTPQGGVISPLLSNIYLHVFDISTFAISWRRGCSVAARCDRLTAECGA